ncbi:MAG: hypothetical protein QOJ98_3504 [Acidobacteriota bacterium]|jgi:hypothetical protein|nr:hypothetical protein [Acidobacteriota bacterium]
MTAATDVLIFFVGLTVWSEQVPSDCGVKAILPRVVHESPPSPNRPPHVQNHAAGIVFRADSFVSLEGWGGCPRVLGTGEDAPCDAPNGPTGSNGPNDAFWYVPLDGDPVRFVTNGATNVPASLHGLKLPRLQQELCPAKPTLTGPYQPPYSGAAAVVTLPEGTLQACMSVPADADGRLDTRLRLKTAGNLVIDGSTMRDIRRLQLKPRPAGGPIEVMIANVPETYYQGDTMKPPRTEINGMSHENAYHAMSEPGSARCTMSLTDWWNQLVDPDPICLCESGASAFEPIAPIISTSLSTSGGNFACSNTTWP